RDWPSPGQYIDLRNENHSFDQMAIAQTRTFTLTGRERPERINVMMAEASLLPMLGAKPKLGRLFSADEDKPGKSATAILTSRVWRCFFSSAPAIIGKSISINGNLFTVVGVLQPELVLDAEVMPSEVPMDKVDIFLPLQLRADAANNRFDENYNIL